MEKNCRCVCWYGLQRGGTCSEGPNACGSSTLFQQGSSSFFFLSTYVCVFLCSHLKAFLFFALFCLMFYLTLQIDCFVCSFCFRFTGSIEHQIGRRLYLQELRANESHGCDVGESSENCHEVDSSDEEEKCTQQCTSGSSSNTKVPLPEGVVESLMNGQLILPCSEKFSLPPAVPCNGGCGEAYYCR